MVLLKENLQTNMGREGKREPGRREQPCDCCTEQEDCSSPTWTVFLLSSSSRKGRHCNWQLICEMAIKKKKIFKTL